MAVFNPLERKAIFGILIAIGILLATVSGGFLVLANALDGLRGMGNPSSEMLEQSRKDADTRNLIFGRIRRERNMPGGFWNCKDFECS